MGHHKSSPLLLLSDGLDRHLTLDLVELDTYLSFNSRHGKRKQLIDFLFKRKSQGLWLVYDGAQVFPLKHSIASILYWIIPSNNSITILAWCGLESSCCHIPFLKFLISSFWLMEENTLSNSLYVIFFQRKNASQHSKINFDCRQSFPIKMWLFILGFPQYFMNISVKNYSNKMILYNFKQPAERAVWKCPKLFLTVLPDPRNSRNKSGKSFAGHPVHLN